MEFLPHDDARCRFFTLLHYKGAILEAEHVLILVEEHGEDLFFVSLLRLSLIIAEHENVAADRVPMEIAEEENVSTLQRSLHHQLRVVIDRVKLARGANPLSIQVLSHQRAPVVAHDDSVRVQHRYNLEDEGASQELRMLIVTH